MLCDLEICYDSDKGELSIDKSITLYHAAVILMTLLEYPISHLTPVTSVLKAVKTLYQMRYTTFFIGPSVRNFQKTQAP